MKIAVLASGSRGNAILIRLASKAILVDAGLGPRTLKNRLSEVGESLDGLEAVFISHEHIDHIQGLEALARNFKIPFFATEGTWEGIEPNLAFSRQTILAGEKIKINNFEVQAFRVPHDAREPVGFVIQAGGRKVSIATDLGSKNFLIEQRLKDADVIILESNYDPFLLKTGPYPWPVKQRIMSRYGHLSNYDCAELVSRIQFSGLKKVVLAHLSEVNNQPEIAWKTVRQMLKEDVELFLTSQTQPGPVIELK